MTALAAVNTGNSESGNGSLVTWFTHNHRGDCGGYQGFRNTKKTW